VSNIWLTNNICIPLSGPTPLSSAGQQRDAWHNRPGAGINSITGGARPSGELSLRPGTLSAAAAAGSSSSNANGTHAGSSSSGALTARGDLERVRERERDRERERSGHAAWSHFHTGSRAGRGGPHPPRDAPLSISPLDNPDRFFQPLGSPFKHAGGNSSSSGSSSRRGLQRSVSDSGTGGGGGAAANGADAAHGGNFGGSLRDRDRHSHHSTHGSSSSSSSHRQSGGSHFGGGGGGGQFASAASANADDKLGWRDSNRQQQHGPSGGAAGRGWNKVGLLCSGSSILWQRIEMLMRTAVLIGQPPMMPSMLWPASHSCCSVHYCM
jgi:hypothetical protein